MPVEILQGGTTVATGDGIELVRLLSIRGRLHLEAKGLKSRGGSIHAYVKRTWGLKGNRQRVIEQFEKIVQQHSATVQRIDRRED